MTRQQKRAFRERHYHKKRDGILRVFRGEPTRFLTMWERVQFFFGACP